MRFTILATVLALGTLAAVPAFAAPGQGRAPTKTERAEGGDHAKKFPMLAAEFKAKVDKRQAKARTRMEERAAKLPADKATQLRTRFDARMAKVNAEVAKAIADGTVTKEEAKAIRAASPHRKHGHGGHGGHGGDKNGK